MKTLKTPIDDNSTWLNANILVVGLGLSGCSTVNYLDQQGLSFRVVDSRSKPPAIEQMQAKYPHVDFIAGDFAEKHFFWADIVILSPGVSRKEQAIAYAIKQGKNVIGDIELFMQQVKHPVIAITGSNGKSTVTCMLDAIGKFSAKNIAIGGNIGVPALDLLIDKKNVGLVDLYVLELSSFQLESTTSLNFSCATILNITEDHMDRYSSMAEYITAKKRIMLNNGVLILNRDDETTQGFIDEIPARKNTILFSLQEPAISEYGVCEIMGEKWICVNQAGEYIKLFKCSQLLLPGKHNTANAIVAIIISRLHNIETNAIEKGLTVFKGLPHRSQIIHNINNIRWINDSKATNTGATQAAIKGMAGENIILIMGGQGKQQDFKPLSDIIKVNVKNVILFGEDAEIINESLVSAITRKIVVDLDNAIQYANQLAIPGDCILFSPSCASFDMFKNYEHRGEMFIKLVKDLIH